MPPHLLFSSPSLASPSFSPSPIVTERRNQHILTDLCSWRASPSPSGPRGGPTCAACSSGRGQRRRPLFFFLSSVSFFDLFQRPVRVVRCGISLCAGEGREAGKKQRDVNMCSRERVSDSLSTSSCFFVTTIFFSFFAERKSRESETFFLFFFSSVQYAC